MKQLFALGFILQILAQISFSVHSEEISLLEPIDFIHWTLLIGIVLIIPYSLVFSKGIFHTLGASVTLIGIVCHIGMCTIDLVLWSFRNDLDGQGKVFDQLIAEPTIWPIFITIGPALLIVGLSIQAIGYWKGHFRGTIMTIIGALLLGVGTFILPEYRVIYLMGYCIFAAGLLWIAFKIYQ